MPVVDENKTIHNIVCTVCILYEGAQRNYLNSQPDWQLRSEYQGCCENMGVAAVQKLVCDPRSRVRCLHDPGWHKLMANDGPPIHIRPASRRKATKLHCRHEANTLQLRFNWRSIVIGSAEKCDDIQKGFNLATSNDCKRLNFVSLCSSSLCTRDGLSTWLIVRQLAERNLEVQSFTQLYT